MSDLPPQGYDRANAVRKLQRVVARVQGYICPICGKPTERRRGLSLDHVIPRSRGGADRLGNLIVAHVRCNSRKGNRMPTGCEVIWLSFVNVRLGIST